MKPNVLDSAVSKLLIPFIQKEYSHFINYKQSALYAQGAGFFIAAKAYEQEAIEEAEHSARLQKYLTDWNVVFTLPTIEQPEPGKYTSLIQTIVEAYNREHELYEDYEELSKKMLELDICTFNFLAQFLKIQVDTVAEYSDKINLTDGCDDKDKFQMLMLEEKLFT